MCRSKTLSGKYYIAIFLGYLLIWLVANYPGLSSPWWMCDDFGFIVNWNYWYNNIFNYLAFPKWMALSNGRPLEIILSSAFLIDNTMNNGIFNIIMRYIQGVAHCLSITIILIIVFNKTFNINFVFYILPLLIWPFNGEAVLWRSAFPYPFAALLSSVGLYLILINPREKLTRVISGIFLIILSVLTNQVSAFLCICVYFLILGVRPLNSEEVYNKETLKEISAILLGLLIGGSLSYLIGAAFGDRVSISSDITEKYNFLLKLWDIQILNSKYYPNWIIFIQLLILILPIILILYKILYRQFATKNNVILTIFCYLFMFFIPYSAVMLSRENSASWRVMYISPILYSSALLYSDYLLHPFKFKNFFLFTIVLLMVTGYVYISRINSYEFYKVFNNDLKKIEMVNKFLSDNYLQIDHPITIATFPGYTRTWNPYNLRYMNGDTKISAVMRDWYVEPFLKLFSSLEYIKNPTVIRSCQNLCMEDKLNNKSMKFHKMKTDDIICICP